MHHDLRASAMLFQWSSTTAIQEYLPRLLRKRIDSLLGKYHGYDEEVNPAVANDFTECTFRFGHGVIQEFYPFLDEKFQTVGGIDFTEGVFKSAHILTNGRCIVEGYDKLTRENATKRGRDHRIPGYVAWCSFCRLPEVRTFDDLNTAIHNSIVRSNLEFIYKNVGQFSF